MRVENWVGIGSGNSLSPVRRQAITETDAELLSIGANFSEIQIEIQYIWECRLRNGGHFVQGDELIKALTVVMTL